MGADHLEWARSGPRRLVGVDLTPRAVAWTAQRLATYGMASHLREADAEHLPFPDGSFDIVYSWGVLHHSPDTVQALREAHPPCDDLPSAVHRRADALGPLRAGHARWPWAHDRQADLAEAVDPPVAGPRSPAADRGVEVVARFLPPVSIR